MAEWVIRFIEEHGYLGIAALMVAENLFPPMPSELIMPFAGFLAARGDLRPELVVPCGALGALVGALPWYFAGRALGCERVMRFADRHGQWLTFSADEVDRSMKWFARRGPVVLVIGRLVPALRTVVSLPAGIARLPLHSFVVWTLLGSALWCSLLTGAGYLLEAKYEEIAHWLNPASTAILAVIVVAYLVRLVRHRRRRSSGTA
ncbi:MAG TPA: DedA family protein [Reyranella sp.]|nr:DedA family protein [Reyranella sp.]